MYNPILLSALALNTKDAYTIALGIGTVFVGLICLIVLCKILSVCVKLLNKNSESQVSPASTSQPNNSAVSAPTPAVIPNRREFVAAIAAAIAEEEGTDISAIRILSIEKL